MSNILTTAYKHTVQDRKFLRLVGKDIAKGEYVYPSMLSKYNEMQKTLPRTKNPLINVINWFRTFRENLYQISQGDFRRNNNL